MEPKPNLTPNIELEEKLELDAIPVFRNNDLYAELFPKIKALFEKGEEPSAKKIYDEIIKHKDKKVILDKTCLNALLDLEIAKLEDFPKELDLKEIPVFRGEVLVSKIFELLKKDFSVEVESNTIDYKISKVLGNFSFESIKTLLEIAKSKNNNIKEIYILTNNLTDHIDNSLKDKALEILKEEIQKEFGFEPKIVPIIDTISDESIQVIVDRHNHAVSRSNLDERFPKQVSMLPLENELFNNQQFLGNELRNKNLIKELRKEFIKS